MPTYITLKDVKKRWGKGQEDVFPVAQFEKLWGDMTALPEWNCRYVAGAAPARPAAEGAGATGRLAARRLGGGGGAAVRMGVGAGRAGAKYQSSTVLPTISVGGYRSGQGTIGRGWSL